METPEYENLERVEKNHWYYTGKREIVKFWIKRCKPLGSAQTLLDFGAGSGLFASEWLGHCQVKVYDSYPQSQEILRRRFPPECVLDASMPGIPLPDASSDCLTALDVLEHLADDAGTVREFHRVLRPSGLAVITVPADMKLWSDWDVALLHYRRYDRRQLTELFDAEKWEIIRVTYKNIFVYPAVYLLRKLRQWRIMSTAKGNRAEDRVPAPLVNRVLRFMYSAPAKTKWFPAPFGVSLLIVARKH